MLGTASQAPTRERNHNGYLLRWGSDAVLVDAGEGTQRQMVYAGVKSSSISHICLTHRHGDHTLGLPGVLQRMVLDQRRDPVTVIYPDEAERHVAALLSVADVGDAVEVIRRPLPTSESSRVPMATGSTIVAVPLDHRVPTLGYRIQDEDQQRLDADGLRARGLSGPPVGELVRTGQVTVNGERVHLREVSVTRPGRSAAVVMDTKLCPGIAELVADVDLAVVEATYLQQDEELAEAYGHLTAEQAARAAATAGARRLVLTHFSQRYPDLRCFADEAAPHHPDVVIARDLDRVLVPTRADRQPGADHEPAQPLVPSVDR